VISPAIIWRCVSGLVPDVRNDERSHELGIYQTPDAKSRTRRVIGHYCQVFATLAYQLADQPMRRSDAHEATDHQ
jgi:hypothetical protein